MEIKLTQQICQEVGRDKLAKLGIYVSTYSRSNEVNLANMTTDKVKMLISYVEPFVAKGDLHLHGARQVVRDMKAWLALHEGKAVDISKADSMEQFMAVLKNYLKGIPGHRVYQHDTDKEVNYAYYVEEMVFTPRHRNQYRVTPAHVTMTMLYIESYKTQQTSVTFWPKESLKKPISEVLLEKGIYVETDELREEYLKEKTNFDNWNSSIGKQFLARGEANEMWDGSNRSWWNRSNMVLDKNGEPTNVVIDVFNEDGKEPRPDRDDLNLEFWADHDEMLKQKEKLEKIRDKEETEDKDDFEEAEKPFYPEIPIHPTMIVFSLKKHCRLTLHISQLEEYVYDKELGHKLVLPKEHMDMIETLVNYKSGYTDIVKGKGNSVSILCQGEAGTGKTLTAEVCAEMFEKPLYSIQCSQLGIKPEEIEETLLKIFARAHRWGAILLLDEADVYISARGKDILQNSIVGVFLRTMEYFNGVMFMTTNRSDMIDDAISSRCIARIDYTIPKVEDQRKIWGILAETAGVKISPKELDKMVEEYDTLTGRDIKNILKLAKMVSLHKKKDVDFKMLESVKIFKPTKLEVKEEEL